MNRLTVPLPTGVACASPDATLVERGEGYVLIRSSRLAILHGCAGGQFYRSEYNSWSPSGWNDLASPPLRIPTDERRATANDPAADDTIRHRGSWMGSVVDEVDGSGILVGALEGGHPRVRTGEDHLAAFDESRPALWLLTWGSEASIFDACVHFLNDRAHTPGRAPRVWCSWYSYYGKVSWDVPSGQLPGLARPGFNTLQIDDSWQKGVGGWRANEKFGEDLGARASDIAALGVTPGVRVAPFITRPGMLFLTEHPEAFMHAPSGELAIAGYNWEGPYYALGTTHLLAQEYLRDLARSLVDADIGYVKADFANAAAIDGMRREADVTGDDAYVIGSRLLREALGGDAYLLGSGALVTPSIGIYDGIRVGRDTTPTWKNYTTKGRSDAETHNAFMTSVARLWLRPLIGCDPDVVFFWHMRNLLGDREISWLQGVATVAGFKSSSDPLEWLTGQERSEMAQWLARREIIEVIGCTRFRLDRRNMGFAPGLEEPEHCYPVPQSDGRSLMRVVPGLVGPGAFRCVVSPHRRGRSHHLQQRFIAQMGAVGELGSGLVH